MIDTKRRYRLPKPALRALNAAGWIFVILLAFTIWPASLGGPMRWAHVTGHSMEPTYYTGDIVLTCNWCGDYEIGDIILYTVDFGNNSQLGVIHRIAEEGPTGGWYTQGDNKPHIDAWEVTPNAIEGKAVLRIPGIGNPLREARNGPWIPMAAGILVALYALSVLNKHDKTPTPDADTETDTNPDTDTTSTEPGR